MDNTAAISELRALASGDQRPAAARLRDLFDEVQAAIRAGVRRVAIRDTLARHGLDMPFASFVRTLARIRKERGIVRSNTSHRSRTSRPTPSPAIGPTEDAPNAPTFHTHASATASGTSADTSSLSPGARERRPIAPVGEKLPGDWLTATLTRDQKRLLTSEQRNARAEAKVKKYWPNPFDPVPPQKE